MKKLLLTLPLLSSSLLFSQTTMCFKENHNSLSTIESTKLDGGKCNAQFSINDMKEKNWIVSDIKVTPKDGLYDFVYILKKEDKNNSKSIDIEDNIIKKIEEKATIEKKQKEDDEKAKLILEGKELYKRCTLCHGLKGELSAYNSSEPLNSLSLEDMKFAINQYTFDLEYGNGNEIIMQQYAKNIDGSDLDKIYAYLKSVNK